MRWIVALTMLCSGCATTASLKYSHELSDHQKIEAAVEWKR